MRALRHLLLLALVFLLACSKEQGRKPDKPLVLSSIPPLAYLVARIGGDYVEVQSMIPPGASAENYEPQMQQLHSASSATMYFSLGHPDFVFESIWLKHFAGNDLKIINTSENIDLIKGDAHVWLSPRALLLMADNIERALSALMPEKKNHFEARCIKLKSDIEALLHALHELLSPYEGRSFLVYHPAWAYFAKEFGLQQVAIEEEGKEPGAHKLARVIEAARISQMRVIFVEPQFSLDSAKVLAGELSAKIVTLDPLAYDLLHNLLDVGKKLAASFDL